MLEWLVYMDNMEILPVKTHDRSLTRFELENRILSESKSCVELEEGGQQLPTLDSWQYLGMLYSHSLQIVRVQP